ncbi:MAG: DUF3990 domain-containing protein [Tannerella sp.]|jgi:hypothetical protein|nr:DUF3990 domain-containing protein [Tannerella sp.]
MKVYHGSDTFIDVIDLNKCKPSRDFGRGFYVTKLRLQAEEMAARVAKRGKGQPVVTEFEFEEYAYEDEDLRVLRFDAYNETWLDFIILNRKNKTHNPTHNYDIIEGPVADDAVSVRVNDYLQGKVSKADFLIELIHKKPSHQLCFCTFQSLLMLERTDNKAECDIYHIDDRIIQQLMTDKGLPDTQASNLYFKSNTYLQLIDESTALYQKPWMEIYEMLLPELKLKK